VRIESDVEAQFLALGLDPKVPRLDVPATVEGGWTVMLQVEPRAQEFTLLAGEDESDLTAIGRVSMTPQNNALHYMHWYPSHEAFLAGQTL